MREEKGLNQRAFAKQLEIHNSTLSSYELGDAYPSLEVLSRMVEVSGKSVDWILFGATMPQVEKDEISEQEIRILQLFRRIKGKDREMVLRILELAATGRKKTKEEKIE